MSFVSLSFVVFFALFLVGFALMPTRASRHAFLLVANVAFYGHGTPWFLAVLAVPSLVDYACALRIERSADPKVRRQWLVLSLLINLGILGYYKYANFLGDIIAGALGVTSGPLYIVLPVGISFFTFKTMSYTIDVYRGRMPACRSLWRYAMFVSFFPELVAGPIVRASVFLPQMDRELTLRWSRTWSGVQILLLGLTKKLLIADRLAPLADLVFENPGTLSQGTVIAGVVAYSLQIYCDFSGYSDMAVGIARIIGFDLPENFNMPYLATSITEFWRRWHITLSQWLRDYLYIPLGGNRVGTARMYMNLVLTMLLGGLWHGANWTFVIWGLLHGAGLAAHKLWRSMGSDSIEPDQWSLTPLKKVAGWAATYAFVCVGWVFFRSPDFATAALVLRKIFGFAPGGTSWTYLPVYMSCIGVALAHAIGIWHGRRTDKSPAIARGVGETSSPAHLTAAAYVLLPRFGFRAAFALTVWVLLLYLFTPVHRNPFIYFQF